MIFGVWAKRTQLALFSPRLQGFYPHAYWLCSVTVVLLVFALSWLAWGAAVKTLLAPDELPRWLAAHALTYWALAACAFGCSFPLSLRLFLALYLMLPAALAVHDKTPLDAQEWRKHSLALLLIIAAQAASNGIVSPFSWGDPIAALAKNESIQLGSNTPLYPENYVGAKAFDLSGFTHAYWGSASSAPMSSYSYGTAFLTWLLDPPLIDVTAFFRTVQQLFFIWCVWGSFGFYLFALKGMRLSYGTALVAGVLFLPANPFFAAQLRAYFPLFSGVMLTLPWVLLLTCLAMRRRSAVIAFAAGLTFCLNFYILPSHPETVLSGLSLLLAYAAFIFARESARPPIVLTALLIGLAGGACLYALPILWAIRIHELSVFGHLDQAFRPSLAAAAACAPALFLAAVARRLFPDKIHRDHYLFFAGCALILSFSLMSLAIRRGTRYDAASIFLAIRNLRLAGYLVFCLSAAGLCGLEAMLGLGRKRHAVAAAAACAILTVLAVGVGSRNYEGASKNPAPFLLLRTLIANARGLRWQDQASLRLLRNRLPSTGTAPALGEAIETAERVQSQIDSNDAPSIGQHPLADKSYRPLNQTYIYKPDFNLPAVLGGIGVRFQRILAAAPNDNFHVGAVTGEFFLNDASTAIDSRFMSIYPTLQAIYLIPGEHFEHVGGYYTPDPWDLAIEQVTTPTARQLLGIAGIDLYIFDRDQFRALKDKSGLRAVPYELPYPLDPSLAVVADERSFGMAYLAKDVRYIAPFASGDQFGPPFYPAKPQKFAGYVKSVQNLEANLMALPGKYSVLLEDANLAGREVPTADGGNRLTIENIAGNKAAFNVHCQASPCVLVFNTTDVEGWKAFADDRPIGIKRANYAFLAVEVLKGDHFVWFEHRQPGRSFGAAATLLSYIAGLVALLLC